MKLNKIGGNKMKVKELIESLKYLPDQEKEIGISLTDEKLLGPEKVIWYSLCPEIDDYEICYIMFTYERTME